jgi:hypothetical protein
VIEIARIGIPSVANPFANPFGNPECNPQSPLANP